LPLAWQEQWILHIDDAGSEALLGSLSREMLRLLSRRPARPAERLQALVQMASERGFAIDRLEFAATA